VPLTSRRLLARSPFRLAIPRCPRQRRRACRAAFRRLCPAPSESPRLCRSNHQVSDGSARSVPEDKSLLAECSVCSHGHESKLARSSALVKERFDKTHRRTRSPGLRNRGAGVIRKRGFPRKLRSFLRKLRSFPRRPRSFPRKRESTPTTAHFQTLPG